MLDWYFSNNKEEVWLSTSRGTRTEKFYRSMGWKAKELQDGDEIRFEMSRQNWLGKGSN